MGKLVSAFLAKRDAGRTPRVAMAFVQQELLRHFDPGVDVSAVDAVQMVFGLEAALGIADKPVGLTHHEGLAYALGLDHALSMAEVEPDSDDAADLTPEAFTEDVRELVSLYGKDGTVATLEVKSVETLDGGDVWVTFTGSFVLVFPEPVELVPAYTTATVGANSRAGTSPVESPKPCGICGRVHGKAA